MKRKSSKRLAVLSLMLTFMLTGGIFAYWASGVAAAEKTDAISISIGTGQEVTVTINSEDVAKRQGVLVPVGYEETGKVSEITVVYNVALEDKTNTADGDSVAFTAVLDTTGLHALINTNIAQDADEIVVNGNAVTVTVTITLTEPANRAEYLEVAGQDFGFSVTFTTAAVA